MKLYDFPSIEENQKPLIEAFDRLIEQPNFQEKINIFTATTGAGKTHLIFNNFLPKLVEKKGINLFFYQVPQLELIDEDFIHRSLTENLNVRWRMHNIKDGKNFTLNSLRKDVEDYDLVVVLHTDAWINFTTRHPFIKYYCDEVSDRACIWRDEIHNASSSSHETYKMNVGVEGSPNYKGKLFRLFTKALKGGVLCFGSTATTTNEMEQTFAAYGLGTDLYNVVTDWINPVLLAGESKWMSDPTPVSINGINDPKIDELLQDMVWRLHYRGKSNKEYFEGQLNGLDPFDIEARNVLKKIDYKMTGFIKVENHYSHKEIPNIDLHQIKKKMFNVAKPAGFQWIITNKDGWKLYEDGDVDPIESGKAGDNGWLDHMKNSAHSVRLVIVVLKGNMGINIPNLCEGLILRSSDNLRDIEGNRVLNNSLQTLGRFNRRWCGGLKNHEIHKLPKLIQFEIYKRMNTFNIYHVDTESWKETIRMYQEEYGVTDRAVYKHYAK